MNLIKRIQIWWMRRAVQFWQDQASEAMEQVIQYKARAAEVERQIAELGGVR